MTNCARAVRTRENPGLALPFPESIAQLPSHRGPWTSNSPGPIHDPSFVDCVPRPVDSMRDAVLTVSPNKQYLGIFSPTTPATQVPAEKNSFVRFALALHVYCHVSFDALCLLGICLPGRNVGLRLTSCISKAPSTFNRVTLL